MPNRLADEPSPYLQQHADNPVDWYPWGEAAFEKARGEDRPILLSIGYSSCHWCHVMAEESFEDPELAEVMNEAFVNVKVDREERPDVDAVYMKAVQSMTGQGGWPLTVFLTPEGVPFYGGTYFPPEPRQGMPSFRRVLEATRSAYHDRRDQVEEAGRKLVDALERSTREAEEGSGAYGPGGSPPDAALLEHADDFASRRFDAVHGGFGSAPKFPQAPTLDYLLRRSRGRSDARTHQMVEHTLRRMARGGIRDHLAGGFHRYSVDGRWRVPHFEKMLYDNALLARLYTDAWRSTDDEAFRSVAVETVEWMLDELRGPHGGFYAALDADTEGEEGRYYVWDAAEVDAALADGEAAAFRALHGIRDGGNWEGTNVLHRERDADEVASELGLERDELEERIASARATLRERREGRERPFRDEKVLAGWNGLALRALAEAGATLGRPEWVGAAGKTADFLLDALRGPGGDLLHVWKDGRARVDAFLEDYAALGLGLLSLHGATLEARWLEEARALLDGLLERFWDRDEGILYDAPGDDADLPVRARDPMDNPTPSGTSLAVELLLRAAVLFGEDRYRERAAAILRREAGAMERYPLAFGALLSALDLHLEGPVEVAVIGAPDEGATRALLEAAHREYLAARVVTGRAPGVELDVPAPLLEGRDARGGRPTAYVCRNYACREPVAEVEALREQLRGARREAGG